MAHHNPEGSTAKLTGDTTAQIGRQRKLTGLPDIQGLALGNVNIDSVATFACQYLKFRQEIFIPIFYIKLINPPLEL